MGNCQSRLNCVVAVTLNKLHQRLQKALKFIIKSRVADASTADANPLVVLFDHSADSGDTK